jgi:hypothetical protein
MSTITTIEKIYSSPADKVTADSFSSTASTLNNLYSLPTKIVRSELSSTNTEKSEYIDYTKIIPVDRIYPHIFDENTDAGSMLILVRNAHNDAELALESFAAPDLQGVATYLTSVSNLIRESHRYAEFNRSLGALLSFLRRATLVTPIESINRSALNALVSSLHSITSNPMLDLDDASMLIEQLLNEGWMGELESVEQLIADVLSNLEEPQKQLFDDLLAS